MSQKEKTLAEKIGQLPKELQTQFADRIDGAVMALELLKPESPEQKGEPKKCRRKK